jgi:hypothetical protein
MAVPDRGANEGIQPVREGTLLLSPGAVSGFAPNPDHIRITYGES